MNDDAMGTAVGIGAAAVGLIILGSIVALGMWGCPKYNVWQQTLEGKAALQKATYDRQIAVQEANAKMESATLLANADTLRAHGQARANAILAHSLSGPDGEAYLRYLWIQGLGENGRTPTVVYVPTEAGLPILEARRKP